MLPLVIALVLALVSISLYKPLQSNNGLILGNYPRVLLLTAHPDDEAMFFGPTLLALTTSAASPGQAPIALGEHSQVVLSNSNPKLEVFSLCLSIGNADGLGNVRPQELAASLDILGVPKHRRWIVDDQRLQDNITLDWDPTVIAQVIKPYIVDHGISAILTFDDHGVSLHPNHKALPRGAQELLSSLNEETRPSLFALVSVPKAGKYTSIWGPTLAKIDLYSSGALHRFESLIVNTLKQFDILDDTGSAPHQKRPLMPVFVAGFPEYKRAFQAMLAHKSQLVWFRWLYLLFSRYMWVNEWVQLEAEA
ncbi:N-acetylglucosaminylphosphatidylinositoldeacety la se [Coprinopsis sp. MPI-PUGE-AT-0042]|nr:N-acetylglucosaminylphosphatidylinositoldeacety la se [Coprinopsis sp. MPI-PUGE-AT-0042]